MQANSASLEPFINLLNVGKRSRVEGLASRFMAAFDTNGSATIDLATEGATKFIRTASGRSSSTAVSESGGFLGFFKKSIATTRESGYATRDVTTRTAPIFQAAAGTVSGARLEAALASGKSVEVRFKDVVRVLKLYDDGAAGTVKAKDGWLEGGELAAALDDFAPIVGVERAASSYASAASSIVR